MTDIEQKLPVDDTNESRIEDADLAQVVGGDKATTTTKTTIQDIHFTKTVDAPSPNLFII